MTPEEEQEFNACVTRISELLYQDSQSQSLPMNTLAEIECTVRTQLQTHVSPQMGLFLSTKLARQMSENIDGP